MKKYFKGMDGFETAMSIFCLVCIVGLLTLLAAGIYMGLTAPDHKGQHCVQMNYVHHAKVGSDWECTAWEKN